MKSNSDPYTKMENHIIRIVQLVCLIIIGMRIVGEELFSGHGVWLRLVDMIRKALRLP